MILLSGILGGLTVTGVLAFFKDSILGWIKRKIEHDLAKDLETHKAELKAETDRQIETHKAALAIQNTKEIERLKADLQIIAAERQIQFSRLHERRAKILATTFKYVLAFYDCCRACLDATDGGRNRIPSDRAHEAKIALGVLHRFVRSRLYYLPVSLLNKINSLKASLTELIGGFSADEKYLGNPTQANHDAWQTSQSMLYAVVNPMLDQIADEFRTMVGVTREPISEGARKAWLDELGASEASKTDEATS